MGGDLIGGDLSHQKVAKEGAGRIVPPGLGQMRSHGPVDAHHAGTCLHFEQGGDVAVADEPFGMGRQFLLRQHIHQPDRAVPAPVAKDGLDGRVPEGPFEVRYAFFRLAGVFPQVHRSDMGTDDRLEAPATEYRGRSLHILHRSMVGRRKEGDSVTGLEEGGLDAGQSHRPFTQVLRMFRRTGGDKKHRQATEKGSGHHL